MEYPYVYSWGNNSKRQTLKGKRCNVLQRLTMNSAIVEFEDGHRECISRNALRKANPFIIPPKPGPTTRVVSLEQAGLMRKLTNLNN